MKKDTMTACEALRIIDRISVAERFRLDRSGTLGDQRSLDEYEAAHCLLNAVAAQYDDKMTRFSPRSRATAVKP